MLSIGKNQFLLLSFSFVTSFFFKGILKTYEKQVGNILIHMQISNQSVSPVDLPQITLNPALQQLLKFNSE